MQPPGKPGAGQTKPQAASIKQQAQASSCGNLSSCIENATAARELARDPVKPCEACIRGEAAAHKQKEKNMKATINLEWRWLDEPDHPLEGVITQALKQDTK
jgi:hypothetical protein